MNHSQIQHLSPPYRRTGKLLPLLVGLSIPVALTAGDAVYTWKDAAGRTYYGNRPPEGHPATPVPMQQPNARIYTWTDAEGKVHYGTHPPAGVLTREIREDDGSLSTIHSGELRPGEQRLLQERRW